MEYTVRQLAEIAGISSRTLRYYDEIGLLKPARTNSSGYRIYGQREVDRLQQILFYRELGVDLERIKEIIDAPSFNIQKALREHRVKLFEQRKHLDLLIANIDKTIAASEGGIKMMDQEKFAGFKQKLIEENENKYGEEIRSKYGEETVSRSYDKLKGMTREQYEAVTKLENEVEEILCAAFRTGDPGGELAQKAADIHRQWLSFYWDSYSKEAHAGITRMYTDDVRFREYYDQKQPGLAEFLRKAVQIYTGIKN
jgi:Predicted transcriptional regulators